MQSSSGPSCWSQACPPHVTSINWCAHLNHATSDQFFPTRIKEKYAEELSFTVYEYVIDQQWIELTSFLSRQQIKWGIPNFLLHGAALVSSSKMQNINTKFSPFSCDSINIKFVCCLLQKCVLPSTCKKYFHHGSVGLWSEDQTSLKPFLSSPLPEPT